MAEVAIRSGALFLPLLEGRGGYRCDLQLDSLLNCAIYLGTLSFSMIYI